MKYETCFSDALCIALGGRGALQKLKVAAHRLRVNCS